MRLLDIVVIGVTAAAGAACDESTAMEPSRLDADGRVVGILELVETAPRAESTASAELRATIVAPDTVTAGVPFAATISTIGLSGCWREAGASIAAQPRRAVVTPYDRVITHIDGQPVGCIEALVSLPRTINLTFTQRGEATLRVEGRRVFDGDVANASVLAIEKRIQVR